MIIKTIKKMKL